jgi:hypothetical protein
MTFKRTALVLALAPLLSLHARAQEAPAPRAEKIAVAKPESLVNEAASKKELEAVSEPKAELKSAAAPIAEPVVVPKASESLSPQTILLSAEPMKKDAEKDATKPAAITTSNETVPKARASVRNPR